MRKPTKKIKKNTFEERFSLIVEDYHKAKEVLSTLPAGSDEHEKQQRKCDTLFAKAERCVNAES
ncbi:TPA: hypothetical protein ACX6S0_003593 [Photobacterium damselae]